MKEICLGTAVFGTDYGVTNKAGKLSKKNSIELIHKAIELGIKEVDTANTYGNAEHIIGESGLSSKLKISTKLRSQNHKEVYKKGDIKDWETQINESLKAMKVERVEKLLIHNADDLYKDGTSILVHWLQELKKSGRTKYIGISIYDEKELKLVEKYDLDSVQLPTSIYSDKRFSEKKISLLKERGKDIVARSIFMQGLLLTSQTEWPSWIPERWHKHHKKYEEWLKHKRMTKLESAINYIQHKKYINSVTIGICNAKELEEFWTKWKVVKERMAFDEWAIEDDMFTDPRNWRP